MGQDTNALAQEFFTKYRVYHGRFDLFLEYFKKLHAEQIILERLSDEEISESIWAHFLQKQKILNGNDYKSDEELVRSITRHLYDSSYDENGEKDLFSESGKITERGIEALKYFQKKWLKLVE
ncbi:hypothetical protein F7P07_07835 [Klebsiella pneumoniae]|nr:hypothetical protein F7P07_07835 [Klebsiella pneumoniae]